MTESVEPPTQYDPPQRDRRRLLLAAALAVALLAVVGVALFRGHGSTPTGQTPSPPPSAGSRSPAGRAAPSPVQTPLLTAPAGVRWHLFQGVGLPFSRTDGPLKVSGPVYAGYSHTPAGALIAASQLVARALITPGSGWRQVVDTQLVPNQGREVYRRLRAQVTDDSTPHYAQLAGFRFITYDPTTAVISLVNLSSNGELRAGTVTVRWLDGDWKLQLDATGDQGPPIQVIPNLGGYAPWRGVS